MKAGLVAEYDGNRRGHRLGGERPEGVADEDCFEVDAVLLPCIHVADPEVVKPPEPIDVYRLPDYGIINRPSDNPNIDRPVDNPTLDRQ